MKKVLTTEEWIAKRSAEAAERKKRAKPPKESEKAIINAHRAFTNIVSFAVYRSGYPDPKGYNEYLAPNRRPIRIERCGRGLRM